MLRIETGAVACDGTHALCLQSILNFVQEEKTEIVIASPTAACRVA